MRIDDFNGNNFGHTGLGFIRGGTIGTSGEGTPVARMDVVPPGVRRWGKEYKDYFTRYYTRTFDLNMQAETLPHKANRVDLDPLHRDRWGLPLPRVTFEFHQNEQHLQKFMARVGEKIMQATGASRVWTEEKGRPNRWAGGRRAIPIRPHRCVSTRPLPLFRGHWLRLAARGAGSLAGAHSPTRRLCAAMAELAADAPCPGTAGRNCDA